MMNIITLDFETYYSQDFSLTKVTTEEYVRDERFQVIGVSIKENDGEARWFDGSNNRLSDVLAGYNFANSFVLAHNAMFDSAILSWHYGIKPLAWLDTLSMARATDGLEVGNSLDKLATRYNLGVKGTEVVDAKGKRLEDFTPTELHKYGGYCCNDVDLTYSLFNVLAQRFSLSELKLIDLTIKMYSEPVLRLDTPILEQHLINVKARKDELLEACISDKDTLMSNPKFAELLISLGVEPPMKVSPANGKQTFAFAKSDEGFKALAEHPDERVQALVSARLGTKSTLEETRTQRFIDISLRGKMPVPLRYYAAHTGRWGGDDKLNLQNLPRKSLLKSSIVAPTRFCLIDADSSQIEARTIAWLAGQNDLVDAFERKEDVYKIMASSIYNKAVEDITDEERFVGKTTILGCFGENTEVLTNSGWKRIDKVQDTDLLWDGEEWVKHQGLVPQGEKEVLTAWGIDATPEHEILTEYGWLEWKEVCTNPLRFLSALSRANLPSQDGLGITKDTTPQLNVLVDGKEKLETLNYESKNLKKRMQTYDIAYAGTRNRYTIKTSHGAIIVHNCGYGMGATKFAIQLKTFGVEIEEQEAKRIIDVYRQTYPKIPELWKEANRSLDAVAQKKTSLVGCQPQALSLTASGFLLPSGLHLGYYDLRKEDDGYSYGSRRGRVKIYGGKVVENLCQAVARCIIGEQMLRIAKRYKVALTVHDAVMVVVPEEERDDAIRFVHHCMSWRPSWAKTLPLACEIGAGKSYADCGKKKSIEKWGL